MSKWIKFGVSLLITGVCLWWTFKDTRWNEMWTSLKSANWIMVLPFLLSLAVIHVARTLRWGNLLSGMERIRFKSLNEASAIGFMMLIILPFRLGEFARPFLIAQRSQVRRSAAMTTVVLERIVDGIVIAVLLRILLFFLPGESADVARIRVGGNIMFLVFFGGFCFLMLARWQHDRVIGLMRAVGSRVSKGLTEKAIHIVDGFVGALKQLPDGKNLALFVLWTAVYWGLNGASTWLLANAFDCSAAHGEACQPLTLSLYGGFVVLSVLVIGLMIPAAPGSAGTFQASMLIGLGVFMSKEVVNSSGVAFANVVWVLQIAQQILTGLVFMSLSKESFADIAGHLGGPDDDGGPPGGDAQKVGA